MFIFKLPILLTAFGEESKPVIVLVIISLGKRSLFRGVSQESRSSQRQKTLAMTQPRMGSAKLQLFQYTYRDGQDVPGGQA